MTLFGKKTKHIALATIIFVSGLISLSTITNGHNWGGDFAAYIMQAESLLDNSTHDFIKENGFAIKNSNVHFAPISYPWGYPFLLASMIYFMGSNLFAMKLLNIFLYALFLGILFLFLQKRLSSLDTLILVAIFAINPVFLSLHNFIISDIAFLFFSTLTIFLIDHTFPQDKISIRFSGRQIILGFVIFLAFSIRTNGILLLFSLIVYDLFSSLQKKRFSLTYFSSYFVFIILWVLYSLWLPGGENSHFSFLGEANLTSVRENIIYYFELGKTFFRHIHNPALIYNISLFFFLVGLRYRYKEDLFLIIYFFFTLALYIFWPFQQGVRFLLPVFPLFIYLFLQGLKAFSVFIQKKTRCSMAFQTILFALLLVLFMPQTVISAKSLFETPKPAIVSTGPYDEVSTQMFNFVSQHTPEDSVIVFFKPRVMRLITNRASIIITECSQLTKGDYIVLNREEGSGEQISSKELKSCPLPLDEIYISDRFIIYQTLTK